MEQKVSDRNAIAARVAEIIEARRSRLPRVEADLQTWEAVGRLLLDLSEVQVTLLAKKALPPELRGMLQALELTPMHQQVAQAVERLRVVQARLSRETLNIGVTGQARVGKSTFLQSISGLGDDQVPV